MTEPDDDDLEQERLRVEEARNRLLAKTAEIVSNRPSDRNPNDVERDRQLGRENRERRRKIIRESRIRKWEKLCPVGYHDASISNIDSSKIRKKITEWLDDPTCNLALLSENSGVGKTFIARAIARELFAEGMEVEFHKLPELLVAATPTGNNPGLIDEVKQVHFLILDDVGVEKPSEWRQEVMWRILDFRRENELPTIITSNLDEESLLEWLQQRNYTRLMGGAMVLKILGPDRRFGV